MRRVRILIGSLILAGCTLAPGQPPPGTGPQEPSPQTPSQPIPSNRTPDEAPFTLLRITPQQVKAMRDAGQTVVMADVRPASSYARMHIQEAVSMPLGEISTWGPKLTKDQTIVFYCT